MSVKALDWALKTSAPATGSKFVLIVMADLANDDGVCWPGRKRLAAICQVNPATISKYLADLESAGLIWRGERRRSNGSRTTDWTVLAPNHEDRGSLLDADPEDYSDDSVVAHARTGQVGNREGGQVRNREGGGWENAPGQVAIPGIPEPSKEPSKDPEETPSSSKEVWDHYQAVFPGNRKVLDAPRKRVIARALKVRSVDECKLAITALSQSDFHNNRGREANGKSYNDIKYALGLDKESPDARIDDWVAKLKPGTARGLPGGLGPLSSLAPGHKPDAERVVRGRRPNAREFDVEQAKSSNARLVAAGIELVFEDGKLLGWREIA